MSLTLATGAATLNCQTPPSVKMSFSFKTGVPTQLNYRNPLKFRANSISKNQKIKSTYPTVKMMTRIERLIQDEGIILLPGIYDALSASILEKVGFSAGWISGFCVSASLLGKPDIGFLTPPEMAATTSRVCAAADIPFIADADTGGGNALNIQRTIKDLIRAGAAGCFLEDQAWPKKCGHFAGKQVIPAEEHAAKIASARDAIGNSDFFLVARTDARATSVEKGLSDAISRANFYLEAGADACFVEAPRDDDELREIARRTKGYRACNMLEGGKTPLHTPEELKAMGFHLILHSTTSIYAAAKSLTDVLGTLRVKGTTREDLHQMASFSEFNEVVNLDHWYQLESRFSKYTNGSIVRDLEEAGVGFKN
ncbi:hypothetical protein JCGZ_25262 [Jatropha curcas]|uniref:Isocitrate lyase n=1 Tax=Jatropha curcas TaxID=180498 RepID=A0A067L3N3_JATCU|nr:carboxyvinyl-carboxyphosphonate phosphorylmutase, chloroplastic [Jatropha curcas]KDP43076.1 hypothetical protein JCGZ_25262 [Jatropha curcas]